MANIYKKPCVSGGFIYRLNFGKQNLDPFNSTFSNLKDAEEFRDKYEQKHLDDPINYNSTILKEIRFRDYPRTAGMKKPQGKK